MQKIGFSPAHRSHISTYNVQKWVGLPGEVPSITESILKKCATMKSEDYKAVSRGTKSNLLKNFSKKID